MLEGLWTGRAARDVDVYRDDLVYPLHHTINIIHPPTI
jgi:hypothetical protein